ncbi:lysine decarboxylase, partial [Methanoculleus sp. FWC-SCC1]|nr:lysine decarboxylase [Methanoculleus sp. FWC-SCC1]
MTPAEAYRHLVRGTVAEVPVRAIEGRAVAKMVVPYPPGIPVIMPGERCTAAARRIADYLAFSEDFDNRYPGFENEMHGVVVREEDGRRRYSVFCIEEEDVSR